jgi:hypothetical protein
MSKTVIILGNEKPPCELVEQNTFYTKIIDDPYVLKKAIKEIKGETLILNYLEYIDIRYLKLIVQICSNEPHTKVVFIIEELSEKIKLILQRYPQFIILWDPEKTKLVESLLLILSGEIIDSRQEKRNYKAQPSKLGPPHYPLPTKSTSYINEQISEVVNISKFGCCLKLNSLFFQIKDYVNVTFRDHKGDYVSADGQIRWIRWNQISNAHEFGVQFLALL